MAQSIGARPAPAAPPVAPAPPARRAEVGTGTARKFLYNGGAGARCSETGELVVSDCTATGNAGPGFHAYGRIRLERCTATDNVEHGLLLEATSTGVARGNHFTKNDLFVVARDPGSAVTLERNRMTGNKKGTTKVAPIK